MAKKKGKKKKEKKPVDQVEAPVSSEKEEVHWTKRKQTAEEIRSYRAAMQKAMEEEISRNDGEPTDLSRGLHWALHMNKLPTGQRGVKSADGSPAVKLDAKAKKEADMKLHEIHRSLISRPSMAYIQDCLEQAVTVRSWFEDEVHSVPHPDDSEIGRIVPYKTHADGWIMGTNMQQIMFFEEPDGNKITTQPVPVQALLAAGALSSNVIEKCKGRNAWQLTAPYRTGSMKTKTIAGAAKPKKGKKGKKKDKS